MRLEDRAVSLADKLVYARQREWQGILGQIDRFKLRRQVANLAIALCAEENDALRAEVERLRGAANEIRDDCERRMDIRAGEVEKLRAELQRRHESDMEAWRERRRVWLLDEDNREDERRDPGFYERLYPMPISSTPASTPTPTPGSGTGTQSGG